ncbi:sigma-70 family RNA polymerase sigma factor [Yeguia hominis]|uniref:Sigma-70 family RNA polymerase sigma factor n=1 Tax=Yeguia hominis TaxID=2763662 RepID=A0A926HRR9_9FIRM|nr:sigma-70 family RNA polymerase sigma factor [Yeguia hominis]MBC8532626.1 sigma-70 family RNA polymerase sigma factor [Yeguia hominis]
MDKAERERFIEENLGLVHACAKRFRSRGMEYDDLFQAGCMGLVKAADHFEPERGYQFSTYAVPVILGEMRRLFREGGTVKVGRALKELSLRAARETERFLEREGRTPAIGELAALLGIEVSEAAQAISAGQVPLSLTREEEEGGQADIPVDAPEEKISERLALQQVLSTLEPHDRNLIIARYFKHRTQTETARQFGMTQVQVSRREKKILAQMREALK